jgi:hypothetical protein
MLAQPVKVTLGRLAAGFERDAQNIERVEQAGHHVRRSAERGDQLGAFFVGEAHDRDNPNLRCKWRAASASQRSTLSSIQMLQVISENRAEPATTPSRSGPDRLELGPA